MTTAHTRAKTKSHASVEPLNRLLADAIVFQHKARHYHWTVKGPHFKPLHELFERFYTEWAERIDDLAERVMALEGEPVRTLARAIDLGDIKEDGAQRPAAQMIRALIDDLSALNARVHAVGDAAGDAGDRGTENMMDDLTEKIEKDRWMLRVQLED